MRRSGWIAAALLAWCSFAAASAPAAAPETIPALTSWHGSEARLRVDGPLQVVAANRVARPTARVLAGDLRRAGHRVRAGERATTVIRLARGAQGEQLGREGYELRIGDRVRIVAPHPAGLFYGTRTVLQLLAQGSSLPRGTARDRPRYPERGLMVDAGRKYFTPKWFRQHVRELAYLKLNYLHLHLSDDQGFRIESDSHPEIVSGEHLTKSEVRQIVALARRYHVTVVPEIDMPGHMAAALEAHPELQLRNVLGQAQPGVLDVTNPAALRFARELVGEYLSLFPGPYWHLGADEVIPFAAYPLYPRLAEYAQARYGPAANAKDAIHDFVNRLNRIVVRRGKTMRMWGDDVGGGSAVTRSPNIVAEWWTDLSPLSDLRPPTPQELLDRGHRIMNGGWFPTYYVQGPLASVRPDMQTAYETWEANRFYGPLVCSEQLQAPPDTIDAADRSNLGAKLHVWNDEPEAQTEEEIAQGIAMRLRVIADKAWLPGAAAGSSYDQFLVRADRIGSAPGFTESGAPPSTVDGRDCLS